MLPKQGIHFQLKMFQVRFQMQYLTRWCWFPHHKFILKSRLKHFALFIVLGMDAKKHFTTILKHFLHFEAKTLTLAANLSVGRCRTWSGLFVLDLPGKCTRSWWSDLEGSKTRDLWNCRSWDLQGGSQMSDGNLKQNVSINLS